MNWLDKYIMKNDSGYLIDEAGNLFVELPDDYVRGVGGNEQVGELQEIPKDKFLSIMVERIFLIENL